MNQTIEIPTNTLRQAWESVKKAKPGIRIREAAQELGVSEAELLATTVGEYSTRLEGDWTELLSRLKTFGRVMSLTRNDSCVLEHKGPFQRIDIMGKLPNAMATVIGPIESRVFFKAWTFGFAVMQQTPNGLQQSIQIFDEAGTAITKIFLQEEKNGKTGSNQQAFDELVKDFTSTYQSQNLKTSKVQDAESKPLSEVDQSGLLADWSALKDTHDFYGMLMKHKVNRLDAVVLAKDKFSHRIPADSLRTILERASEEKLPIMIFVGNRGNLQIHQGKVQTIHVMEQWLNVLDPDFNMHLREDHVETVWVVKKPTTDGVVTSVEVYDKAKNLIVQFFGLRKPGIPELEGWRKLVDELLLRAI
jgi:putative hemin transport protein